MIFIFLTVLVINIPYFFIDILPRHDTFAAYTTFYYFYNHLFFYNNFPHWMPYLTYGLPALFYQFFSLTPFSYIVIFIGKVFMVQDAMLMFKASILLEVCFFILGLYKVGLEIFNQRTVAILICLIGCISLELYTSICFNFRVCYLFPWAILFLHRFYQKPLPRNFWFCALTFLVSFIGASAYIPIIVFYLMVGMLIFIFKKQGFDWSMIIPKEALSWVSFFISLTLILLYGGIFYRSSKDITPLIREHFSNSLEVFLNYGGSLNWQSLFSVLGWGKDVYAPTGAGYDNTFYIGFIGLFFLVVSIIYVKDAFLKILLGSTSLLLIFSFGGLGTKLSYFLPGMSYYRHIGLIGGPLKVLILIISGYGLKYFLENKRPAQLFLTIGFVMFFLMEGFGFTQQVFKKTGDLNVKFIVLKGAVFFIIAGWATAVCLSKDKFINFPWAKIIKGLLFLIVFLEIGLFQFLIWQNYPKVRPADPEFIGYFNSVRKMQFDESRMNDPQDIRWLMMTMIQHYGRGANYVNMFNSLNFDPCRTDTITETVSVSVKDLRDKIKASKNKMYERLAGCSDNKKYGLLKTLNVAVEDLKNDDFVPLLVEVKSFNANQVVFDVGINKFEGGWFYYSDAFNPIWNVRVDGQRSAIKLAPGGLKAVYLKDGRHTVDFYIFDVLSIVLQQGLIYLGILALGMILFAL